MSTLFPSQRTKIEAHGAQPAGGRAPFAGEVEDGRPRRLLVVRNADGAAPGVTAYALGLGGRLGCEVMLLTLGGAEPAASAAAPVGAARQQGILEYRCRQEEAAATVERLCREIKRIEFILTDSDEIKDILCDAADVPVFRIVADAATQEGERTMSAPSLTLRPKPLGRTLVYGAVTAALYAVVFWKADQLMAYFTRGGFYAVLPIATAVVFSFAHGAFASNLWSLLGIEARRPRIETHKTVSPAAPPAKAKTKRPRAYAYVNPFHNIELKRK